MRTSFVGKVAFMPSKYDEQTRAKAVRLVIDHVDDYDSEWAAIKAVSARLGMTAETLRRWVRQAQIDAGQAVGVGAGDPGSEAEERRTGTHD
jgi:transposase